MKRLGGVAASLLLVLPGLARGQVPELGDRVDSATRAAVEPVLEAAARDSLPVRTLESKVLEGVAKGRPAGQIAGVVTQLADEFRLARTELRQGLPDESFTDGEVVAAAFAMRQGVSSETIRSLWAARADGESLEIPMTVLSDLVRRGVPAEQASAAIANIVRSGVPLQIAAQIPGRVDGALVSGAPPGQALADALRTLHIPSSPGRGRRE